MILLISGPRSLTIEPSVIGELLEEVAIKPTKIVTGGARGVDKCAEAYANMAGIPYEALKPLPMGPYSAIINNKRLEKESDALLAITDGMSKGTANMIQIYEKKGKPHHVFIV